MPKKLLSIILIFFCFNLFSFNIIASDTDPEEILVREFVNNIGKIIIESKNKQTLIDLFNNSVDFMWVSRFVLGKNYRNLTDEKKLEFSLLYRQFLIKTYGPKFDNYNAGEFKINKIIKKKRYFLVKSSLKTSENANFLNIDFRIKKYSKNNQIKIIDIVAEGISLIETHRSEFSSVISREGIENFLSILKEKVKNLNNG